MSVILVATVDTEYLSILSNTIEALGHTPLPLRGTENVVEDVTLNDAELVLVAPDLLPCAGGAPCEILREDPTVPAELPILLLIDGKGDVRRIEKTGFSGTLSPALSAAELSEEIVRQLGENAAPADFDPVTGQRVE